MEKIRQKCKVGSREIKIIESKNQVGNKEMKSQLKLFEPSFMPALIYRIKTWQFIKLEERKEIEIMQGKDLKGIFKQPVSATNTGKLQLCYIITGSN